MVDTINLNQNTNPVTENQVNQNVVPDSTITSGNFYEGFNKPNQVNVNLVAEENPSLSPSTPVSPEPKPVEQTPPPAPVTPEPPKYSDFKPAQTPPPTVNNTYNTALGEPLNWKGILFISAIGIFTTLVFGIGSYFVSGSIYNRNLEQAKISLAAADNKLAAAKEVPAALTLPIITPPSTTTTTNTTPSTSTTETTKTTPTTTVNETPIQTPATDVTTVQGQG